MPNRQDSAYVRAVARSLYWGYSKEVTGEPGRLAELTPTEQKFWVTMAQRAIRRIEELDAVEQAIEAAPTLDAGRQPRG